MKIELEFAELHSPLFFLGRNLGMKLQPMNDPKQRDLSLIFDTEMQWLEVHDLGRKRVTYVPVTNCGNLTPVAKAPKAEHEQLDTEDNRSPEERQAAAAKLAAVRESLGKRSAQVETPQSHVHAGAGHGKR